RKMRGVLADARHAMRGEPARVRVDQRPRSGRRHVVVGPGARERAGGESMQLLEAEFRHCFSYTLGRKASSAAATLSAINVDSRTLDSRVTPAICGVRIRFGQPESGDPRG